MASGSSGRGNSASKGFDFGSDDILCSYDDYANRDSSSNGNHADPDFHKARMSRTSMFPATAYNPPEDSLSQDVIATVEKSMKKYADNLMRFLEGISSRLSQLELYCYNLDKSIGEMRSDLTRDHVEQDSRLKSLEKHLQEVHRSVQILRDKQELADTQKELAKLQLAQKESSSSTHSQSNEERSSPTTDPKKTDNPSDANNQQLALALPHQIAPQQQPAAPPAQAQAPAPNVTQAPQQPPYYMPPTPLQNPPVPQLPQNQYLPSDQQYRTPQLVAPQPTPSQVTPSPPVQQFSHYQQQQPQPQQQQLQQQQQWSQQVPSPQPPSMQSQTRPPSPAMYPPYQPNQATNPSPAETLPNSMPMQVPYSGVPPPGSSRADTIPYGYGGAGRTVPQQPPPQQMKGSFPAPPGEMYGPTGSLAALPPPSSAYMMYEGEGGRTHHPPQPHFTQPGYPPTSASLQNPPSHNLMVRNPNQSQFVRNHPYNDLIEKLVSMGFRGDHVVSVIQRMEESGQAIDFNSVLDRLNVHSSVGPQRGWSG
ncbi:arginine-glutamic acid dipeptide repeats protein-like [Vigna unguiculata]|uniref:arginine-glutamic acid dipeptide repeats protein-like n=1 Tax=Vigna unguiculata TaxID=3917 RepID=UPI0010162638|nr:arginine-glutamic acid dipeptide repeats protein-like [Vigna unguiculata]